MPDQKIILTVLGSAGGVAKAILSVLEKSSQDAHDPIHPFIRSCRLHLVDQKQKTGAYYQSLLPRLFPQTTLHQFDLNEPGKFRDHLLRTKTTHVIDVSWADTVQMLDCCSELGVKYINTALENTMVDENERLAGYSLLERYRIFEENRARIAERKSTAIIGSGMNPGVVQWMALDLMKKRPDELPLACYIVEHDDSIYNDPALIQGETVYSTWSPECFLDEAVLNYPMFMKKKLPLMIFGQVYEQDFKVTLGSKTFYGCLMPHEEVITLGKTFDMETGFIYRVSDYMTNLLHAYLEDSDPLWDWEHHVLDPAVGEVGGRDMVGVLLVYPDKEIYKYNVVASSDVYPEYRTNATYLQVACGIYGALSTLLLDKIPEGVYFVDELLLQTESRYGEYLCYYMRDWVEGENPVSDGLLLDRMRLRP